MLFIAVNCVTSFTETKAQSVSVNFSMFQNQLSPYGRWINNPRYGQVWIYRDANFRPYYTDGHWEYTNYGWSWVSDYDWGWAPFHYGRWEYDNFYGWMWIPFPGHLFQEQTFVIVIFIVIMYHLTETTISEML